jgi:hypothetical protein
LLLTGRRLEKKLLLTKYVNRCVANVKKNFNLTTLKRAYGQPGIFTHKAFYIIFIFSLYLIKVGSLKKPDYFFVCCGKKSQNGQVGGPAKNING